MNIHFNMQKHKKLIRRRGTKFLIVVNWRMGKGLRLKMKMNFLHGVLPPYEKEMTLTGKMFTMFYSRWCLLDTYDLIILPQKDLLLLITTHQTLSRPYIITQNNGTYLGSKVGPKAVQLESMN